MVAGTCGDKQTSGCEDHNCAHMYRRVGGMMTDVHVAILSKPLHICENLPPALHFVSLVMCVLGGELPQLSSCKQNMYITWWVGPGGAMVAGTCGNGPTAVGPLSGFMLVPRTLIHSPRTC